MQADRPVDPAQLLLHFLQGIGFGLQNVANDLGITLNEEFVAGAYQAFDEITVGGAVTE